MGTYKELIVWQKADELAFQVYLVTRKFPKEEIYGLTAQVRRVALSVPTNMVEGSARKSSKELLRFLYITIGSLRETEYLLSFARRLGYLEESVHQQLEKQHNEVGKILFSWTKKIDPDF